MEQHYRLFSSYREPGTDKDLLRTDLGSPGTDFIIVACRNQVGFSLYYVCTCHYDDDDDDASGL